MFREGLYKVKSLRWGFTQTTNDHEQFWMQFQVLGEVDPNQLDESKRSEPDTRTWSITLATDRATEWLISVVQHLGYDGDDLLGLDPDRPGAFNFEGREFVARCKHEEYNGQLREKWTVNTSSRTKLPADRLVALNGRYAHMVKTMKKQRLAKTGASSEPTSDTSL